MERHTREEIGLVAPRGSLAFVGPRRGAVVHCPGNAPAVRNPSTLAEAFALARQVQGWHFARGWADIGYHRGVWRGHLLELRSADRIGAHAGKGRWPASGEARPSFNRSHLGILVLVPGNVECNGETLATLAEVLDATEGEVVPHHSLTFKSCPGASVRSWLHRFYGNRNPYTNAAGLRVR